MIKFSECKRNAEREVFICVKISTFFSYKTLKNEVNSDDLIWLNLVKSQKMILIGSERDGASCCDSVTSRLCYPKG